MGILGQKSKVKAAPHKIHVEKVVIPSKPAPPPSSSRSGLAPNGHSSTGAKKRLNVPSRGFSPNLKGARPKSASPYPSSADETRSARKRKAVTSTPRDSPAFGNDSDDDDENDDYDPFSSENKRARRSDSRSIDLNRKLRHKKAFGDEARNAFVVDAAEIASVKVGCQPIFGAAPDEVAVELQYPSMTRREQYELVWMKDKIDAVKDILKVVSHVAETYLTDDEAQPFVGNQTSIKRQLERAANENIADLATFKSALTTFNEKLLDLVKGGSVAKNLDQLHHLPLDLVTFILEQVYDRIVAPNVDILNKYQAGSDNVYGELLHPFVHRILVEHGNMTSDQVFIDLGSGVGNVVLQAALEIGCRSYGCEMVENSCNFAEAQEKEFKSRCLLWGVAPGRVNLERGDFRTNKRMLEVLREADVVLVNNKAFTAGLNDALINMFLDLKPGCKVISLKSFVHDNKTAVNDVANSIFEVEQYRYLEGWVSWAASEGDYYVATRK